MTARRIAEIDSLLVRRVFEPLAWGLERTTGLSHFAQAECVLLAWPVASFLLALAAPESLSPKLAFCMLLCGVISGKRYWVIRLVSRPASRLGASFERDAWYLRAAWILFIASMLVLDGWRLQIPAPVYPMPLAELLTCWLCACNDPPPAQEDLVPHVCA